MRLVEGNLLFLRLNSQIRDIYYRDPTLFKRQAIVDRYVDDIAHTCGVTRADLHVVSSIFTGICGYSFHGQR